MATMPVDESRSRRWQMFVFAVLGFWLSSSLMLDFVVMPSLYVSGMMDASGFAVAGYSMFGSFNRVELLCAGLGISGVWMLCWEKALAQGIVWQSFFSLACSLPFPSSTCFPSPLP
ncbi:MAG: hypothetical protein HC925_05090 [Coleofasciculaceae cyanobacterium SM2_3_26]|nr:hypothetical protein [Coleofasciculaceae cyanobacterium SM2_3_26]